MTRVSVANSIYNLFKDTALYNRYITSIKRQKDILNARSKNYWIFKIPFQSNKTGGAT